MSELRRRATFKELRPLSIVSGKNTAGTITADMTMSRAKLKEPESAGIIFYQKFLTM
jgi:hypothetical protein